VRNPRDLLSHVRRLYLANALEEAEAITGALTDIFLVLGRRGRPLRRRLLNLVGAIDDAVLKDTNPRRGAVGGDEVEIAIEIPIDGGDRA